MKILNEEQLTSIIRDNIKEWYYKKKGPISYSMNDKIELVDDPNVKDGGNFPIKRNGKEYWVSRSNTVSLYVFGYDKNGVMHVLINKRGNEVKKGNGRWSIISGYLDYNETLENAAVRECWEETGVKIDKKKLINIGTNSRRESVNTCFYSILDGSIEEHPTAINNSENGEISDAKWVPIKEIDKYDLWHGKDTIKKIANKIKNKKSLDTNNDIYGQFLDILKIFLKNKIIDNTDYKTIISIVNNKNLN